MYELIEDTFDFDIYVVQLQKMFAIDQNGCMWLYRVYAYYL